jgi:hypothetical protein
LWLAEKQSEIAKQHDSGLYSIDKLFTEKELSMTYNTAALAAHEYIVSHKPFADGTESPSKSESSSDGEKLITTAGELDGDDPDSPPSAVAMDRQYSHATRSTRGAGLIGTANFTTGIGIEAITDINYPGNMTRMGSQFPKLPPHLPIHMQKAYVKGDSANSPVGLSHEEATNELEFLRMVRKLNDDRGFGKNLEVENGGYTLLEAASQPRGQYNYWVKGGRRDTLVSNLREEIGGEPMSKQSSAGDSEIGGVDMSRQNTGEGVTSARGRKRINALG